MILAEMCSGIEMKAETQTAKTNVTITQEIAGDSFMFLRFFRAVRARWDEHHVIKNALEVRCWRRLSPTK